MNVIEVNGVRILQKQTGYSRTVCIDFEEMKALAAGKIDAISITYTSKIKTKNNKGKLEHRVFHNQVTDIEDFLKSIKKVHPNFFTVYYR